MAVGQNNGNSIQSSEAQSYPISGYASLRLLPKYLKVRLRGGFCFLLYHPFYSDRPERYELQVVVRWGL